MDEGRPRNSQKKHENRDGPDTLSALQNQLRGFIQQISCPNCKQIFNWNPLQNSAIRDLKPAEQRFKLNHPQQTASEAPKRPASADSKGRFRKSQSRTAKSKLDYRSDLDSGPNKSIASTAGINSSTPESLMLSLSIPESLLLVDKIKQLMTRWRETALTKFDPGLKSPEALINRHHLTDFLAKQGFGRLNQVDRFGNVTKSTFIDHKPHGLVIEDNGSTTEAYYCVLGKKNGPYLCRFASGMITYGSYCEDQRFGVWGFVHPDQSFEQINHGFDALHNKIY